MTQEPDIDPTTVECPTCDAWKGWACEGDDYGYHAAGYHPARHKAAVRAKDQTPTAAQDFGTRLADLQTLRDDWDGDGAPAPNAATVVRGHALVAAFVRRPDDLDPDAIGGVAAWYYGVHSKVMVGLRNDGSTVVCVYTNGVAIPSVESTCDPERSSRMIQQALATLAYEDV